MENIVKFELYLTPYQPITASSCIPIPSYIKSTKAVVNVANKEDDLCLLWSVLAELHPQNRNPDHMLNYKSYLHELNNKGLNFPLAISDVSKFERLNNNISINVFAFETSYDINVYPVYITKNKYRQHHINLLCINDQKTWHYVLINNMSRLLGDHTKHNDAYYYCDYCLHGFQKKKH